MYAPLLTRTSPYRQVHPHRSATQPTRELTDDSTSPGPTDEAHSIDPATNIQADVLFPTPATVDALLQKLRPHELRWLGEDIINAAISACETGATDRLHQILMSWIETADVMVSTRRRWRHILRARQEGRERFAPPGRSV